MFKVIYHETLSHVFYLEADSKEDAENKFQVLDQNCELDFSDGEVIDSEYLISEINEGI